MLVKKSYLNSVIKAVVASEIRKRYGSSSSVNRFTDIGQSGSDIPENDDKYTKLAGSLASKQIKNPSKTFYSSKKQYSPAGVRKVESSIFNKVSWRYMVTIRRLVKDLSKTVGEMNTRMTYSQVVAMFSKIDEIKHQIELNMARIRRMV